MAYEFRKNQSEESLYSAGCADADPPTEATYSKK